LKAQLRLNLKCLKERKKQGFQEVLPLLLELSKKLWPKSKLASNTNFIGRRPSNVRDNKKRRGTSLF
jgi:hypothetical protein